MDDAVELRQPMPSTPPPLLRRRSFSERTFSRVEAGSLRGSICALCCSAIGMGVLLLPYTMAQVGPIFAFALLAVSAVMAFASLRICCAGMHATKTHSYSETLIALFSVRFSMLLTFMLVVACFGMTCGYFVFASQLIQQLMIVAGMPPVMCDRKVITAVVATIPCLPLSLYRNLSDFRYLSFVSLAGLAYLALLVIFRTPSYTGSAGLEGDWLWEVRDWYAVPKCLSLCFAAYTVHMNVFACYDEMQNPTAARVTKVLVRSSIVQTTIYVSIAFCGFLSFGALTPDNILHAYSLSDNFANVGRAVVSFNMLVGVPLTVHPGRKYLWLLITFTCGRGSSRASSLGSGMSSPARLSKSDSTDSSASTTLPGPLSGGSFPGRGSVNDGNFDELLVDNAVEEFVIPHSAFVLLTVGYVFLCAVVAAFVQSASDLLGVVGGFAAVTYAYILPAEIARVLRKPIWYNRIDWSESPAAFLQGRVTSFIVIACLHCCGVFGYVAAAQCAWRMVRGA